MTKEKQNPVDVLAEDFAKRLKAGNAPSIEAYAKKYPKYADEIRAVFPTIQVMERVNKQARTEQDFEKRIRNLSGQGGEVLGDFLIKREVGRGGMGIVYEAEQQSLKRQVALKILAPHVAESPVQLKRFHREAKAAARLHHTNIVPVYGVGEADGLHFYAMQYIEGVTLQDRLSSETDQLSSSPLDATRAMSQSDTDDNEPTAQMPAPNPDDTGTLADMHLTRDHRVQRSRSVRESARIVRDVALALAYAHDQGVHHRDIKPANLLLDPTGTVWVTDFGLAKHEADDAATRTGDIVGTLRYMAPEQFNGETDARSDICSLGLTLFEMITLQPAYEQMRVTNLMHKKANEPPPSPRKLDSSIPADLDTIVTKASATAPGDRYQSAADLAEDLDRFLEDRPIRARRISPAEKLWRWARRNPAIASLSAVTFALLITTAVTFAVGNYQTNRALDSAKAQQKEAERQEGIAKSNLEKADAANQLAQSNLSTARAAFTEIIENISSRGESLAIEVDGEEFIGDSVVTEADAKLLSVLLDVFERLAESNKEADLSQDQADALAKAGVILEQLRLTDEARTKYSESLVLYAKLSGNQDTVIEQLRIYQRLIGLGAKGYNGNLLKQYTDAVKLGGSIDTNAVKFQLAAVHIALARAVVDGQKERFGFGGPGGMGRRRGSTPGREGGGGRGFSPGYGFQRNGGDRPDQRDRSPGGRRFDDRRSRGGRQQGPPGREGGRPGRDAGRDGGRPGGFRGFFYALREDVAHKTGEKAANEAVGLLEYLAASEPSNADYRLQLAKALLTRANLPTGRMRENQTQTTADVDRAIDLLKQLGDESKRETIYRFELAKALLSRARLPQNRNPEKREDAIADAFKSLDLFREVSKESPSKPAYQFELAKALAEERTFHGLNASDSKREALQRKAEAISVARKLHNDRPSVPEYQVLLAELLSRTPSGLTEAVSLYQQLVEAHPEVHQYRFMMYMTMIKSASSEKRSEHLEEALARIEQWKQQAQPNTDAYRRADGMLKRLQDIRDGKFPSRGSRGGR